MMSHSDQRGIVSGNYRRKPRRESPESMLVGPMGVDDIRPAPPKGVRYELPLLLVHVAGCSSYPKGANVNRQLIAMQHDLVRDVRIKRYERYVMTTRNQTSDLVNGRRGAEPFRNCRSGQVEKISELAQARLACNSDFQRARPIVIRT
jgi:hypothetical protein